MPTATRTFRVFVSSTFEDLKAERDALQRDVFPRLRKLCEANNACSECAHGHRPETLTSSPVPGPGSGLWQRAAVPSHGGAQLWLEGLARISHQGIAAVTGGAQEKDLERPSIHA